MGLLNNASTCLELLKQPSCGLSSSILAQGGTTSESEAKPNMHTQAWTPS